MKLVTTAFVLLTVAATASAEAQGRGRNKGGIPPGHLPPPGECRVWYDGVPPDSSHRPPVAARPSGLHRARVRA